MNIHDIGAAISALRRTLEDYGIDPKTQEDTIGAFSKHLVEEEIAASRENTPAHPERTRSRPHVTNN